MKMNRHSIQKQLILVVLAAVPLLISACSHVPFSERYQPGAETLYLWRGEPIPLEAHWRYLGEEKISVRGKLWNSFLTPVDRVRSLVFMRDDRDAPEFLILSQVEKTSRIEVFRFLGGSKTIIGGYPYREDLYALSADTTDPEYRRYVEAIRAAGITPAPSYKVRVLDRLPVDSTLVRIMELTPGAGHRPLPAYGALYPQERLDPLHRRSF